MSKTESDQGGPQQRNTGSLKDQFMNLSKMVSRYEKIAIYTTKKWLPYLGDIYSYLPDIKIVQITDFTEIPNLLTKEKINLVSLVENRGERGDYVKVITTRVHNTDAFAIALRNHFPAKYLKEVNAGYLVA